MLVICSGEVSKMARVVCLLALFLLAVDARPNAEIYKATADEVNWYIIGGSDAAPGAWPWQLSQQRFGTIWSHSCGSSLLSSRYSLSAAHCVDGADVANLRVVAGLHDRSDESGTQTVNLASFKMHERYNLIGEGAYGNDIAILTFETDIQIGGSVQVATLPPDNTNTFAGDTCVITGWGRTTTDNTLPNILQQASIGVIASADCNSRAGITTRITDNHICVVDAAATAGACNGDSGGPINCPSGSGHYVTGIASFVFASNGNCNTQLPSVYTRVSAYLDWIATNTP